MKSTSIRGLRPLDFSRFKVGRNLFMVTFYCFLILILASEIQCKKSAPPKDQLPPITQDGNNSFGCRVNGVIWVPHFNCSVFTGNCKELGLEVFQGDSISKLPISFTLGVKRTGSDGTNSSFIMYSPLANVNQTGNIFDSIVVLYQRDTASYYYHFPPSYTLGAVNLTKLDTINNIIAGTFYFTLHNSAGDSVVITDGRFDLNFKACLCH